MRDANTHYMAKSKKSDYTKCWQGYKTTNLSYILIGSINWHNHGKLFGSIPYDSTISLLVIDIIEIFHKNHT